MARINRRELLSEGEIQVVHCVNRCVRRGFLCGTDELTGQNYEHRREWIRNRLEFLAGIFGIDILGFSVMSNHLHAILRNRPDVVRDWTDEEVARRWWNLFPSRRNIDGSPAEPAETDLKSLLADAKILVELRARLSSISWFMRCTSEVIARLANAEDDCSGRFVETSVTMHSCSSFAEVDLWRGGGLMAVFSQFFCAVQCVCRGIEAGVRRISGGRRDPWPV